MTTFNGFNLTATFLCADQWTRLQARLDKLAAYCLAEGFTVSGRKEGNIYVRGNVTDDELAVIGTKLEGEAVYLVGNTFAG